MSEKILEVKHLGKAFGSNQVLRDIDFSVSPGDVTCIIGPSGSGKSTLLRCLNMIPLCPCLVLEKCMVHSSSLRSATPDGSETEEQLQLLQDLMLRRISRDSLMYPPGIFPNVVLQLSEKFSFK